MPVAGWRRQERERVAKRTQWVGNRVKGDGAERSQFLTRSGGGRRGEDLWRWWDGCALDGFWRSNL